MSNLATLMPPSSAPASATPLRRVLLVDQSLPNRRLISEILTSFHLCQVDEASSAEQGFERLLQQSYDLLILNRDLPEMPGTLLDRMLARMVPILHHGKHTAPPTIFLVPKNEIASFKETHRDARTLGAVPLPINLEVLMSLASPLLPHR